MHYPHRVRRLSYLYRSSFCPILNQTINSTAYRGRTTHYWTPHRSGRAELPHPALQLYIHSCRFYLHVPDNKTSTFVPLSSDIQFPAQLNLNMTNWNSVFMRYPALHLRRMFLSQFKYNCQLLRHVQGFPLLRLLWADLTSKGSSLASLFTKHPYHILWNTFGSLKFSIHLYIHATA